jgi:hypothetical protein
MQLSRFAAFANRSVSDVRFFAEPCLTTQDMVQTGVTIFATTLANDMHCAR